MHVDIFLVSEIIIKYVELVEFFFFVYLKL